MNYLIKRAYQYPCVIMKYKELYCCGKMVPVLIPDPLYNNDMYLLMELEHRFLNRIYLEGNVITLWYPPLQVFVIIPISQTKRYYRLKAPKTQFKFSNTGERE